MFTLKTTEYGSLTKLPDRATCIRIICAIHAISPGDLMTNMKGKVETYTLANHGSAKEVATITQTS